MENTELELIKNSFLATLESLGGKAGQKTLRKKIRCKIEVFDEAKRYLVSVGLIKLGKGKGGSVILANFQETPTTYNINFDNNPRLNSSELLNTRADNVENLNKPIIAISNEYLE
ncbi:MAG: hypothetical protein R3B45_18495, partial [Bdellovibrionota bacterium]